MLPFADVARGSGGTTTPKRQLRNSPVKAACGLLILDVDLYADGGLPGRDRPKHSLWPGPVVYATNVDHRGSGNLNPRSAVRIPIRGTGTVVRCVQCGRLTNTECPTSRAVSDWLRSRCARRSRVNRYRGTDCRGSSWTAAGNRVRGRCRRRHRFATCRGLATAPAARGRAARGVLRTPRKC